MSLSGCGVWYMIHTALQLILKGLGSEMWGLGYSYRSAGDLG